MSSHSTSTPQWGVHTDKSGIIYKGSICVKSFHSLLCEESFWSFKWCRSLVKQLDSNQTTELGDKRQNATSHYFIDLRVIALSCCWLITSGYGEQSIDDRKLMAATIVRLAHRSCNTLLHGNDQLVFCWSLSKIHRYRVVSSEQSLHIAKMYKDLFCRNARNTVCDTQRKPKTIANRLSNFVYGLVQSGRCVSKRPPLNISYSSLVIQALIIKIWLLNSSNATFRRKKETLFQYIPLLVSSVVPFNIKLLIINGKT